MSREPKGIIFSGGPLSGKQMMVESDITTYSFKLQPENLPPTAMTQETAEDKSYYRSKYKVGDCELFIYEDDV